MWAGSCQVFWTYDFNQNVSKQVSVFHFHTHLRIKLGVHCSSSLGWWAIAILLPLLLVFTSFQSWMHACMSKPAWQPCHEACNCTTYLIDWQCMLLLIGWWHGYILVGQAMQIESEIKQSKPGDAFVRQVESVVNARPHARWTPGTHCLLLCRDLSLIISRCSARMRQPL